MAPELALPGGPDEGVPKTDVFDTLSVKGDSCHGEEVKTPDKDR
jgi:hypothetical protein